MEKNNLEIDVDLLSNIVNNCNWSLESFESVLFKYIKSKNLDISATELLDDIIKNHSLEELFLEGTISYSAFNISYDIDEDREDLEECDAVVLRAIKNDSRGISEQAEVEVANKYIDVDSRRTLEMAVSRYSQEITFPIDVFRNKKLARISFNDLFKSECVQRHIKMSGLKESLSDEYYKYLYSYADEKNFSEKHNLEVEPICNYVKVLQVNLTSGFVREEE